jgi:hypothetical protein
MLYAYWYQFEGKTQSFSTPEVSGLSSDGSSVTAVTNELAGDTDTHQGQFDTQDRPGKELARLSSGEFTVEPPSMRRLVQPERAALRMALRPESARSRDRLP